MNFRFVNDDFKVNVFIQSCSALCNFMANGTEAWRIKNTNFPAKYMNSRSPSHWNIHQVSVRSASCETIAGVLVFQGCTIMRNVIAYSIVHVVQSQFCKLLFFCIFYINVMFASILISNTTTHHLNDGVTDYYKISWFCSHQSSCLIYYPILSILDSKWLFLQ